MSRESNRRRTPNRAASGRVVSPRLGTARAAERWSLTTEIRVTRLVGQRNSGPLANRAINSGGHGGYPRAVSALIGGRPH